MKCFDFGATILIVTVGALVGLGINEGYKEINPPPPPKATVQHCEHFGDRDSICEYILKENIPEHIKQQQRTKEEPTENQA